jgi:hypothetical protein
MRLYLKDESSEVITNPWRDLGTLQAQISKFAPMRNLENGATEQSSV